MELPWFTPLGLILVDIFMSHLEPKLNRFTTNKPTQRIRYVDDVFCIFNVIIISQMS